MRMDEISNGIKMKRYEYELFEYNMTSYFFVTLTRVLREIKNET